MPWWRSPAGACTGPCGRGTALRPLVAFTYLLQNVAVTKVATYAFVNPMIAVLLGVLLLHERLAKTEITGMVVIICAVAMVVFSRVERTKPKQSLAAAVAE